MFFFFLKKRYKSLYLCQNKNRNIVKKFKKKKYIYRHKFILSFVDDRITGEEGCEIRSAVGLSRNAHLWQWTHTHAHARTRSHEHNYAQKLSHTSRTTILSRRTKALWDLLTVLLRLRHFSRWLSCRSHREEVEGSGDCVLSPLSNTHNYIFLPDKK